MKKMRKSKKIFESISPSHMPPSPRNVPPPLHSF